VIGYVVAALALALRARLTEPRADARAEVTIDSRAIVCALRETTNRGDRIMATKPRCENGCLVPMEAGALKQCGVCHRPMPADLKPVERSYDVVDRTIEARRLAALRTAEQIAQGRTTVIGETTGMFAANAKGGS
jgi:hypothetical protein